MCGRKEECVEFRHTSVLLRETVDALHVRPDGIYVDGTLGGGGHSSVIAGMLSEGGRLIGIDQDAAAIEAAAKRLGEFGDRVTIIRSNYADMKTRLLQAGITPPIYVSGNIPGGMERNQKLIERYMPRIKHL